MQIFICYRFPFRSSSLRLALQQRTTRATLKQATTTRLALLRAARAVRTAHLAMMRAYVMFEGEPRLL